jgi:hypothetical protein
MTLRNIAIGVAVTVTVGAVLAIGLAGAGSGHRHAVRPHGSTATAGPSPASQGLVLQTPDTVAPSQSPVQVEYDQQFAQSIGGTAGLARAGTLLVPYPAIAGRWPKLPVANSPETWAPEFVAGLLDIDYAYQSRMALGAWLQANEAPMLLPGLPADVADKMLYLSLLEPFLLGGQATPILSGTGWAANAKAGVRQSVSGLLVQTDPSWARLIDTGWQPTDVRMTCEDVSGLLTIIHGSRVVAVHRFSLQMYVGSARWHGGYGTETVTGWTEN